MFRLKLSKISYIYVYLVIKWVCIFYAKSDLDKIYIRSEMEPL